MNWTHNIDIYAGKRHQHPLVREGELIVGVRVAGSVFQQEVKVCVNRMMKGEVGRVVITDLKTHKATTCTTVDQLEAFLA